jgi:bacterioferritin
MFIQTAGAENAFLADVSALRETAGQIMAYAEPRSDPAVTIALLQTVLAAEIICVLRYTMISVSADGLKNAWIGAEFQEQANDERKHMSLVAERIEQLGGTPAYNLRQASGGAAGRGGTGDFTRRVHENLAAERSIVAHYNDLIAYLSPSDPQSCALLVGIISDEEDHANDMEDLLVSYTG